MCIKSRGVHNQKGYTSSLPKGMRFR
ncbi:hypothetical protein BIW11_08054 [Tropilaelaps mercedesae]|uniref:Uncharacterized protein n=1 Tax=Tropilaelaps mercedesae TaxID=418985 RepID=A0A1V9XR77_9ACAR|nr:hypothetical protein BIW11_08054 [Tropilaelaps mercedesae]